MRVSFGTRSPQALRFSARSEGGGNGLHTGHCFARPRGPSLRSARLGNRPARRQRAARTDPRRSCEAAAGWYPLPTPSGCAEKRRSWGGRVCRRTHTLRRLARRCCLSGVRRTQRVHRRPPQIRASQVARSEAKGRRLGVAFSLVTFSWRSKRKLLRRRAHTPASALGKRTEAPIAPGTTSGAH